MITCKFEDGGDAALRHVTVGALLLNKEEDRVLFIKRAPHLLEGGKIGMPGGYADRNENLGDAVLRETREETGYDAEIISLFRIIDAPNRKGEDRQNVEFVYLTKIKEKVGEIDKETAGLVWISLNEPLPSPQIAFDHEDNLTLLQRYQRQPFPLPVFGTGKLRL